VRAETELPAREGTFGCLRRITPLMLGGSMRILLAEDDEALAAFVRKGLEAEHYAVDVSRDGEQALGLALSFDYDLAILDLTLPRLDGVAILQRIRARKTQLPIMILTARQRVEDRVRCLDTGADDYVVKPFSFAELSARVRALLRRGRLRAESILQIEDLRLDRIERKVSRAGRAIELTSKEFALLEYLMRNTGRRITRTMIIEHVWNASFDSTTNLVDVYINYSSSQVDQHKVGKLAQAIQVAFQELGVFQSAAAMPIDGHEPVPFNTVQAFENARRSAGVGSTSTAKSEISGSADDLAGLRRDLENALAPEIAAHSVALRTVPDGLVISLRELGFFESGSASIRQTSLPAISRIASLLAERSYRIRIEGHTDDRPIHTPRFSDNWELSTARAAAFVRLFIVQYGFSPPRLSAAGFAQYHPILDNATPDNRAQNRRVDVVILGRLPSSAESVATSRLSQSPFLQKPSIVPPNSIPSVIPPPDAKP
jgi:two-component system copper resistance phosphate regulon response regulator CusR